MLKKFPSFKKGGAETVLPCIEVGGGGVQKVSYPRFSNFVKRKKRKEKGKKRKKKKRKKEKSPPCRLINDRSLTS